MGELHGYGYDMTAFDPQNLDSPVEKYEIKTTKSKKRMNLLLIIKIYICHV